MKELDFIEIIKKQIGGDYIGSDCAYLKELGIVVSQDNLVEDIHFKRAWCNPEQLGYKAIAVNISDILAAGAKPAYITVALSLPSDISDVFINNFYIGAKKALYGAKIVGGDITGSKDKIFVSITAIGTVKDRKIASRCNAKPGYKIITRGEYGKSSKGLEELMNNGSNFELIRAHLEPKLDIEFSEYISTHIDTDYAMMDTSDGLADALFKIAKESSVSINAKYIYGMFGSEDYKLVAAVPEEFMMDLDNCTLVGEVVEKQDYVLKIKDKEYKNYDELKLYNHFGGDDE